MLTKTGIDTILKAMWEENGLPAHMEEKMEKIRQAIEERDTILHNFGEPWDDNDEEFEFKALNPVNDEWKNKYDDLQSRYIARFFTGGEGDNGAHDTNGETDLDKVKKRQEDDIKSDDEAKTIDDLFKKED